MPSPRCRFQARWWFAAGPEVEVGERLQTPPRPLALALPEARRKQHEHGQQLEAAQQHAGRQHPFRRVVQRREIARRADRVAQARADIGQRRRRAAF